MRNLIKEVENEHEVLFGSQGGPNYAMVVDLISPTPKRIKTEGCRKAAMTIGSSLPCGS